EKDRVVQVVAFSQVFGWSPATDANRRQTAGRRFVPRESYLGHRFVIPWAEGDASTEGRPLRIDERVAAIDRQKPGLMRGLSVFDLWVVRTARSGRPVGWVGRTTASNRCTASTRRSRRPCG